MSTRDTELDRIVAQISVLQKELDQIMSEPEDDFEVSTIITWERSFTGLGGQEYSYAAIKFSETQWAMTGKSSRLYFNWHSLWREHIRRAVPGSVHWASELTPTEWQP